MNKTLSLVKKYTVSWLAESVFPWKLTMIFGGIFLLGAFLEFPAVEITVALLFGWVLIQKIPSYYLIIPVFFLLGVAPILLLLKRPEQAEAFSTYAYYFMVMALVRGYLELKNKPSES